MKNFKRISSVVLAIVMVFAMMVPAMAADYEITVTNAKEGETYTAYKLFDVEYVDSDDDGSAVADDPHSYTFSGTDAQKAVLEGFEVEGEKIFTFTPAAGKPGTYVVSAKEFEADDLAIYLQDKQDKGELEFTAASSATTAEGETEVTIELTEAGYYFVDTTTGSLCSIDTTHPTVDIEDKNPTPDITKEVKDTTDSGEFGANTQAEIGDVVDFKVTVKAQDGAEQYVVHDTLTEGLTLNGAPVVKVGDDTLEDGVDYDYVTENLEDGCSFEIQFKHAYLDTIDAATDIVITYSATVNEKAIADDYAEIGTSTNTAKLTYGNNQTTETKTTETFTYATKIYKYTTKDGAKVDLDGAEFELYYDEAGTQKVYLVKEGEIYRVATDAEVAADGFESDIVVAGTAYIYGLDGTQTYFLKEIKAPTGYNLLENLVPVAVGTTNVDTDVENFSGVELPQTGGIGTTIFYLVGGLMVTGAFVLLMTKKRMGNRA